MNNCSRSRVFLLLRLAITSGRGKAERSIYLSAMAAIDRSDWNLPERAKYLPIDCQMVKNNLRATSIKSNSEVVSSELKS